MAAGMSGPRSRSILTPAKTMLGGLLALGGILFIGAGAIMSAADGASLRGSFNLEHVFIPLGIGSVLLFLGVSAAVVPRGGAPALLVVFAAWGLVTSAALLGIASGFRGGAAYAASLGPTGAEDARLASGVAAGLLAGGMVALAVSAGSAVGFFAWASRRGVGWPVGPRATEDAPRSVPVEEVSSREGASSTGASPAPPPAPEVTTRAGGSGPR